MLVLLSSLEIDECDSLPCFNGGGCTDKINGFSCTCRNLTEGEQCERLGIITNFAVLSSNIYYLIFGRQASEKKLSLESEHSNDTLVQ